MNILTHEVRSCNVLGTGSQHHNPAHLHDAFFFFSPLLDLTSIHRGCPVNRIVSQNAVLLLWIEVSIEM